MRGYIMALTLFVASCGQTVGISQRIASTTAVALEHLDDEVTPQFNDAHAEALEKCETLACWRADMDPWMDLRESMIRAHRLLLSFQDVIQSVESAGAPSNTLRSTLPCLYDAIHSLVNLLSVLEIRVPTRLAESLGLIAPFIGRCEE